jgi:hypothetical protein
MLPIHSSNTGAPGSRRYGVLRAGRFSGVCAAILLLSASASAIAQSNFEEEFDDADKPWQEVAVQFPTAPATENLLPFPVPTSTTQSFAVDARSVNLGADGVIRYTLVATSENGARSISYEGIRCTSYERKLYAFGQPNGSWSRSRRDKWERITGVGANRQHAALAKDYFCQELTVAGTAEQMVERIRQNRPLSLQNFR